MQERKDEKKKKKKATFLEFFALIPPVPFSAFQTSQFIQKKKTKRQTNFQEVKNIISKNHAKKGV